MRMTFPNIRRLYHHRIGILMVCLLIFLNGCATGKPPTDSPADLPLEPVPVKQLPNFMDDRRYDGLGHAIEQSLLYLRRLPAQRQFSFGPDKVSAAHLIRSLEVFREFIRTAPPTPALQDFINRRFRIYRSVGRPSDGRVLFTGYYEPLIQGRTAPTSEYRYPVYARPQDHITVALGEFDSNAKGNKIVGRISDQRLVPYHDRREIETLNQLKGKAKVLAWVKDRVGLFFLHIQGSGRIYLENGAILHAHYHTTNGRVYRSIGKHLIETGKIPRAQISMQSIRAYLRNNPHEVDTILNHNPSYVFFKAAQAGPRGAINVPLTAGRAIALDRRIFPLGGLAFIQTQIPLTDAAHTIQHWVDTSRFVMAQDTGGAIRGPGRADLFWGRGPYAEVAAGHMQHAGMLYFLVLKPE